MQKLMSPKIGKFVVFIGIFVVIAGAINISSSHFMPWWIILIGGLLYVIGMILMMQSFTMDWEAITVKCIKMEKDKKNIFVPISLLDQIQVEKKQAEINKERALRDIEGKVYLSIFYNLPKKRYCVRVKCY